MSGRGCGCGDGAGVRGELIAGGARVAANSGDELVAVRRLRDGDAALVGPGLEIGVGPGLVEPVTRVSGGLAEFVGYGMIVLAGTGEERIAGVRLGVGDAVLVEEGLKLGVGPTAASVSI